MFWGSFPATRKGLRTQLQPFGVGLGGILKGSLFQPSQVKDGIGREADSVGRGRAGIRHRPSGLSPCAR